MGGSAPTPSLLVSSSSPPLLPALSHFSLRLLLPLPPLFSPPRPLLSFSPAPPLFPLYSALPILSSFVCLLLFYYLYLVLMIHFLKF